MNKLLIEYGFTENTANAFIELIRPAVREYRSGDVIMRSSFTRNECAIITHGTALSVSINSDGGKNIIDCCVRGDLFGKPFLPSQNANVCYVYAKTRCTAAHVNYTRFLEGCLHCGDQGGLLIDFFITSAVRRCRRHIDVLGGRTISERLTVYFRYLAEETGSSSIRLPMSLSDLADYLYADRSAMMREIKKLNDSGIISSKGRDIVLLRLR